MPSIASRIRGYPWPLIFLLASAFGVLLFLNKTLDRVARGHSTNWPTVLLEEMTGACATLVLLPAIMWLVLKYPVRAGGWRRRWPVYLLAAVAYGFSHTTLLYLSRTALFAAFGWGVYDYGFMPVRYFMELPLQGIGFSMIVVVLSYVEHHREARGREARMEAVERQLAQAQLETLQLQLRPHFLFNALNAISAIVYEDAAAADRMIGRLSEFLRRVLQAGDRIEVPLREERELLELYLEIMRARFEEKLQYSIEVDPAVLEALAPQLVLQPVVENAIRHGADPASGRVRILVRARRLDEVLLLEVQDEGRAGDREVAVGRGVGLSNLAARLDRLYGPGGRLSFEQNGNGAAVRISIPFPRAPEAANA